MQPKGMRNRDLIRLVWMVGTIWGEWIKKIWLKGVEGVL